MTGRSLAALAVTLVAGCGARAAMSMTTYADVTCDECKATPALVGVPLILLFDWPGTTPEPDGTVVGAMRWTVECVGAPCHVGAQRDDQVQGDAMVEVIPDGPGPLVVRVVLDDGMKARTVQLDEVVVAQPEAIEVTCTTRRPSVRGYMACGAELPAGNDVRVVARVRAAGTMITGVPVDATLDGEPIADLTFASNTHGWRCGVKPTAADPAEREMVCAVDGITGGERELILRLAGVETALRLVVR